jgi:hypothetical protein
VWPTSGPNVRNFPLTEGRHDQDPQVPKAAPWASGAAAVALAVGVAAAQELDLPQWVWIAAACVAAVLFATSLVLFVRAWTLQSAAAVLREQISAVSTEMDDPSPEDLLRGALRAIQAELRRNRSDLDHHGRWAYSEPGFSFKLAEWRERQQFLAAQPESDDLWDLVNDAYQRLQRLNEWLTSEERKRQRRPPDLALDQVSEAIAKADRALDAKLRDLGQPPRAP